MVDTTGIVVPRMDAYAHIDPQALSPSPPKCHAGIVTVAVT